jgi:CO dehydrogenase/acetyl-CoA synthase alpha subunit
MKDEGRPSDKQRIHDIVEELLSRNLLVAVPGNLGEVLGISEQGRSALAAWDDAGHESQTP